MSAHQCKPIAGGEILNAGTHAGFDAFFDRSYASVVDLLTEVFDSTSNHPTTATVLAMPSRIWTMRSASSCLLLRVETAETSRQLNTSP